MVIVDDDCGPTMRAEGVLKGKEMQVVRVAVQHYGECIGGEIVAGIHRNIALTLSFFGNPIGFELGVE